MRMPVAAQRASISVGFSAGHGFQGAVIRVVWSSNSEACSATARALTTSHGASGRRSIVCRIGLPVIAFAASPSRQIRSCHITAAPPDYSPRPPEIRYARRGRRDGRDASATGCADRPRPRWFGRDGDRQYFRLIRRHARYCKTDDVPAGRVSGDAPGCYARSACSRIRLRPSRGETMRRAICGRRFGASRKVAGSITAVCRRPIRPESQERIRPIMVRRAAVDFAAGLFAACRFLRFGIGRAQSNTAGPARCSGLTAAPSHATQAMSGAGSCLDLATAAAHPPASGRPGFSRRCRPAMRRAEALTASSASFDRRDMRGQTSEPPLPLDHLQSRHDRAAHRSRKSPAAHRSRLTTGAA